MKYDFGLTSPSRLSRQRGVVERHPGAQQVLLEHRFGRNVREARHQAFDELGAGAHTGKLAPGATFPRLGYPRPGDAAPFLDSGCARGGLRSSRARTEHDAPSRGHLRPDGRVHAARRRRPERADGSAARRPERPLPAGAGARTRDGARRPREGHADRAGRLGPGDRRRDQRRPLQRGRRAPGGDLHVGRRARASAVRLPLVDRRRLDGRRCRSTASSSSAPGRARASAGRSTASTRSRLRGRSCCSPRRSGRRRPRSRARRRSCCSPSRPRRRTSISPPSVTAVGTNGGEPIPPGGAVIQAAGSLAAKLQAEAPVGTQIAARLILQPAWTNVVSALGGGPVLVRNSAPVFRSLEDFTNDQIAARSPRAGVGQLADGRIILVAVDGDQPGYSVGLTSFELAQTMARPRRCHGSRRRVRAGRHGRVRRAAAEPAERGRRRACREGGAARRSTSASTPPPPPLPLLTGEAGRTQEQLSYKIVRPSQVTAQLIGPDGRPRVLEAGVQHVPGTRTRSRTRPSTSRGPGTGTSPRPTT